jgi:4-hydroxy-tetrahydrodipicolinate reductase
LGLIGATGRMGQQVLTALQSVNFKQLKLVSNLTRNQPNFDSALNCSVILDFSSPGAVLDWINFTNSLPIKTKRPSLIVGSTGWSKAEFQKVIAYSKKAPVLQSANFSVGIGITRSILKKYAGAFKKSGYFVSSEETHHIHKKDSPSGTALWLLNSLEPTYKNIKTTSHRTGEVVGDHSIHFDSDHDRISISHSAKHRSLFAFGALETALWLAEKKRKPRLYSMDDFLKEKYKL